MCKCKGMSLLGMLLEAIGCSDDEERQKKISECVSRIMNDESGEFFRQAAQAGEDDKRKIREYAPQLFQDLE